MRRGHHAGLHAELQFVYASGSPALTQEITAEVADWAQIGIKVTTSTESFNSVIADCSSGAGFQLCMWGGGWTFVPNYFPTGETLFAVGGGFNAGDYDNATMTADIKAHGLRTLEPDDVRHVRGAEPARSSTNQRARRPVEIIKTLHSTIGCAGSPMLNFMPEYYYW